MSSVGATELTAAAALHKLEEGRDREQGGASTWVDGNSGPEP